MWRVSKCKYKVYFLLLFSLPFFARGSLFLILLFFSQNSFTGILPCEVCEWCILWVSMYHFFPCQVPGIMYDYWLSLSSLLSAITSSKSLIFSVMISVLLLWAIFFHLILPQIWTFAMTHSFLQLIYCVVYWENCVFDPWKLLSAVVKSPQVPLLLSCPMLSSLSSSSSVWLWVCSLCPDWSLSFWMRSILICCHSFLVSLLVLVLVSSDSGRQALHPRVIWSPHTRFFLEPIISSPLFQGSKKLVSRHLTSSKKMKPTHTPVPSSTSHSPSLQFHVAVCRLQACVCYSRQIENHGGGKGGWVYGIIFPGSFLGLDLSLFYSLVVRDVA